VQRVVVDANVFLSFFVERNEKQGLDLWPSPFPSIADAAIVAIAADKRCDAVATFDQKLSKRLKDFSVAAYW
jgi:predicted nucleic acid-binding protein